MIADAFCGIAELYMTDLCFESNAESLCEEAVNNALQFNRNVDVLQTLASLRISQCKKSEACEVLESIFTEFVNVALDKFHQRTLLDEMKIENAEEEVIGKTLPIQYAIY